MQSLSIVFALLLVPYSTIFSQECQGFQRGRRRRREEEEDEEEDEEGMKNEGKNGRITNKYIYINSTGKDKKEERKEIRKEKEAKEGRTKKRNGENRRKKHMIQYHESLLLENLLPKRSRARK